MPMSTAFLQALSTYGGSLITHIGLVSAGTTEMTGGTPAYSRLAVTWSTTYGNGIIRPTADLTFDVAAGSSVSGWIGCSSSAAGTNYGGAALTAETFAGQGQYKLLAAQTGITIAAS